MIPTLTIDLRGIAEAKAMCQRVDDLMKGGQIAEAVRVATIDKVKKRFLQLGKVQNKLGGPRTNYWQQAADKTISTIKGNTVTVSTDHRGVALHLHGGTVRPKGTSEVTGKPIRFLTIPKIAAAHGRTVATLKALGVDLYPGGGGLRRQVGAERDPKNDPLYFIFARSATLKPNPMVLPSVAGLAAAAADAIKQVIAWRIDNAGNNAPPPMLALPWRGDD